jgi:HD superfamily phosphodiesterase
MIPSEGIGYNQILMSTGRKRVEALTEEYGGDWAVQHAKRLIKLVELVGEGLDYDHEVIWLAAHLHDWGTLPRFAREGATHSERSRELAGEHLRQWKFPEATVEKVLEAIEYHHGGAGERCIEAVLLSDADALDGMGAIGVLREFAMVPAEWNGCYSIPAGWGMRGAYERARLRLENNPKAVRLPKSRQLARRRAREMARILKAFEEDSFGCI